MSSIEQDFLTNIILLNLGHHPVLYGNLPHAWNQLLGENEANTK
jgi:hypothetical protein